MEKSGLVALLDVADRSGIIQLATALEGRVYNVDGLMHKTCKSSLHLFNKNPVPGKPQDYISLVDMGLVWRLVKPTPEDREAIKMDGSHYRWSNYLDKICTIIISRHSDVRLIILVNDTYDRPFSIKDDEHD